jgi:hypothetical protein
VWICTETYVSFLTKTSEFVLSTVTISCVNNSGRRTTPFNTFLMMFLDEAPVVVKKSKPVNLNVPAPANSMSPFTMSLVPGRAAAAAASERLPPITTVPKSVIQRGTSPVASQVHLARRVFQLSLRGILRLFVYVWNICSPAICLILEGPALFGAVAVLLPLKITSSFLSKSLE